MNLKGGLHRQEERAVKSKISRASPLCSVVLALLACSCVRDKESERPAYAGSGTFAPMPPAFLTGPASVLLTNVDGFSASARFIADWLSPPSKPLSGELLGRQGKLLFAPDPHEARKNSRGNFTFLWDVAAGRGYVLSEALQAFAPSSIGVLPTNVVTEPNSITLEKLQGHPCRVEKQVVVMTDGSSALFRVWRALDMKQFPLHIAEATNTNVFSLQFSKIRLEAPPAELFSLPAGFTQYPSAEAMMTELVIRQHNLRRGPAGGTEPLYQLRERR